jgi:hypothetical protein
VLMMISGTTIKNIRKDVHPSHFKNLKYKEIPTP